MPHIGFCEESMAYKIILMLLHVFTLFIILRKLFCWGILFSRCPSVRTSVICSLRFCPCEGIQWALLIDNLSFVLFSSTSAKIYRNCTDNHNVCVFFFFFFFFFSFFFPEFVAVDIDIINSVRFFFLIKSYHRHGVFIDKYTFSLKHHENMPV